MSKKVVIGGRERNFSFGLKCIGELVDHNDWGFSVLGQKMTSNPLVTTPLIIYYGAKNGAERNGETVDFELNDVYDWIDEIGLKSPLLIDLINNFSNSLIGYLNDLKGEQPKKGKEVKKK